MKRCHIHKIWVKLFKIKIYIHFRIFSNFEDFRFSKLYFDSWLVAQVDILWKNSITYKIKAIQGNWHQIIFASMGETSNVTSNSLDSSTSIMNVDLSTTSIEYFGEYNTCRPNWNIIIFWNCTY